MLFACCIIHDICPMREKAEIICGKYEMYKFAVTETDMLLHVSWQRQNSA